MIIDSVSNAQEFIMRWVDEELVMLEGVGHATMQSYNPGDDLLISVIRCKPPEH